MAVMNAKGILGVVVATLMAGQTWAAHAEDDPLIVFAASSLAPALEEIANTYTKETGNEVRLSYASSAVLARQIERGAPADLFISAHPDWLDHLITIGAMDTKDIVAIAANRLVLATASDHAGDSGLDLLNGLGEGERLAVGAPETVPLGIYTQEALTALGLWQSVKGILAEAASARAAVALVRSGAARYGILYASDTKADGLVILAIIPANSYRLILYSAGPVRRGRNSISSAQAETFLSYLAGEVAAQIFASKGFGTLMHRTD